MVFLFFSVDNNTDAWKKFISEEKAPEGLHLNQLEGDKNSIWETYRISGIPRYILIDAKGKFIQSHAESPSSVDLAAKLQQLLSKM